MIFFYHVFSVFAILVVVPCFALYSLFSRNKWRRLNDHFGLVSSSDKIENTQKTIWFHALSLGEVVGVTPTIRLLKKNRPQDRIVVSVTTDSGFEAAKKKLSDVDGVFFFPLDCFVFTWTAIKKINPDLFVLVETGFWPGFIHILHLKGVPALLFNGRISSRSMRKYKMFCSFFSEQLNRFTMLCMQNPHNKNKLEWKWKCIPRKYSHRIVFTQLGNIFTATRKCETMKMITF